MGLRVKSWMISGFEVDRLADCGFWDFGFKRGVLLGFQGCVVGMAASMATALQAGTTSASRVSALEVLTYSTPSDDFNNLEFDSLIGRGGGESHQGSIWIVLCALR